MSDDNEWHDAEQALREAGCHRITVRLGRSGLVTAYAKDRDAMATASSVPEALTALVERMAWPVALSMDTPEMMGLSPESEDA